MSDFERHIRARRDELDQIEQPDPERIWLGVRQKQRQRLIYRRGWMAAAAGLLMLIAATSLWRVRSQANDLSEAYLALSPELQAQIQSRQGDIAQKTAMLEKEAEMPTLKADCYREIDALENDRRRYLEDQVALPPDRRRDETLLLYYEQEIRILDLYLKEITLRKNEKERLARLQ